MESPYSIPSFFREPVPLKSNAGRAKAVMIVFPIFAALHVYLFVTLFQVYQAMKGKSRWEFMYGAESISSDYSFPFFGAYLALQLIAIIVLIRWVYGSYRTLQTARETTRFPLSLAVISWFIPVINLFLPFLILRELWRETQAAYSDEVRDGVWLDWFWVCWIIYSTLLPFYQLLVLWNMRIINRLYENMLHAMLIQLWALALGVIALLTAALACYEMSRFEQQLIASRSEA